MFAGSRKLVICVVFTGMLGATTQNAAAQWWWPPTGGMLVEPGCRSPISDVTITLRGDWPDSCIPNVSDTTVAGNEIDFSVVIDPPPGICLTVISPWSLTETLPPLPAGEYSLYATGFEGTNETLPRVLVGTFTVYCAGDLNCDGEVDLADLGTLLADFGCGPPGLCRGDIDGDGDTDLADLGILLANFGTSCP